MATLNEIINEELKALEAQPTPEDIQAAKEAKQQEEKKLYRRGIIKLQKSTGRKVTIMASSENEAEVIVNKTGKRIMVPKTDLVSASKF